MRQRVRLAAVAALTLFIGCSKSSPGTLTLSPAGMNPAGRFTVDPSGVVVLWAEGRLQSKLYVEKGPVTITVKAWGHPVDGEAPIALVSLEARIVGKLTIDSTQPTLYTVTANAGNTGTTVFEIVLANPLEKDTPLANRWLGISSVTIRQGS